MADVFKFHACCLPGDYGLIRILVLQRLDSRHLIHGYGMAEEIAGKDPSSLEKAVSTFLNDNPRPGQPMHYTDEQIIKILETACPRIWYGRLPHRPLLPHGRRCRFHSLFPQKSPGNPLSRRNEMLFALSFLNLPKAGPFQPVRYSVRR